MKSIRIQEDYNKEFPHKVREEALRHAHEIRKFEIELYWKRATYFWTLIAAAFAGYFALVASDKQPDPILPFIVACIGLVLSVGWFQVNRGSKYWQSNWERHVDCLEDEITGPLYKTTIAKGEFPWYKLAGGFPVSVSKTNQTISLFIVFIWSALLIKAFSSKLFPASISAVSHWLLLAMTIFFSAWLLFFCNSNGTNAEYRPVNLDKCDSIASNKTNS